MPDGVIDIMNLTVDQFAEQITCWYQMYVRANSAYFPIEKKISGKASAKGYLEMSDLADITRVLGNPHSMRNRVQKNNTADDIIQKTEDAILNIGEPLKALGSICRIKCWGLTYGSKTLRCIYPQGYGALDSRIINGVNHNYLPASNIYIKFVQFLELCECIKQKVAEPGPRDNGKWYIADIEIALFQFLWDKDNRLR